MTAMHGRNSTYRVGCRCDGCRDAHAAYERRLRSSKVGLPPGDPRHGTANAYANHRCRCAICRDGWAKAYMALRAKRAAVLAPNDPRHGLASTYSNHACRCDACRTAATIAGAALPSRSLDRMATAMRRVAS